jgi:hypothetical protein
MNSVCKGLLEGIDTGFKTRAVATQRGGRGVGGWTLEHGKTGVALGGFDFLIFSDKMVASSDAAKIDKKLLSGCMQPASAVCAISP